MSDSHNQSPDDLNQPPSAWDDERITAYVMGELSAQSRLSFERKLQQNSELATAVAEAQQITEQLAGFYAAVPTLMLDATRREKIARTVSKASRRPSANSGSDSGNSGKRYALWAVAASILLLAVALPAVMLRSGTRTAMTSVEGPSRERQTSVVEADEAVLPSTETAATGELARPPTPINPEVMDRRDSFSGSAGAQAEPTPMNDSQPQRSLRTFSDTDSLMSKEAGKSLEMKGVPEMNMSPERELSAETSGGDSAIPAARSALRGVAVDTLAERPAGQKSSPRMKKLSRREPSSDAARGRSGDLGSVLTLSTGITFSRGGDGFQRVSEYPRSTLSLQTAQAGYDEIRRDLQANRLPPPDSVRIEAMINSFAYDYTPPRALQGGSEDAFVAVMSVAVCPWQPRHQLVRVGLQANPPPMAQRGSGASEAVARNVNIEIEFNPAVVSSYRWIGNANPAAGEQDFSGDNQSVGEVRAGQQVTVLYEVIPVKVHSDEIQPDGMQPDGAADAADTLKNQSRGQAESYGVQEQTATEGDVSEHVPKILTLHLHYKSPQDDTDESFVRVLSDTPVAFEQAEKDFRFAASVAAFGMQLRGSRFAGSWTYDDVLRTARASFGEDPLGLRRAMVEMVETARELADAE